MEKPRNVVIAVRLIWLCYAASMFSGLIIGIKEMPKILPGPYTPLFYLLIFAIYALAAFINHKISSGRNWARIIFTVNFICYVLYFAVFLLPPVSQLLPTIYSACAVISLAISAVQAYALFLLFTKPANTWYQNSRLTKIGKICCISACILLVLYYLWMSAWFIFLFCNQAYSECCQGNKNAKDGRLEKAIEHYNMSLKADPTYAYCYFARAEAYQKLGKHALAEQDRVKAKELGYEEPPPR